MIIVVVLFNLVSHISQEYLALAIAKLSHYLDLSETVAGATLVALSNGLPDILTVIFAAISGGEESNDLAIGSLFGANLFTCTIVFASVIWASKGLIIELRKSNVLMDLTTFWVGILLFLIIGVIVMKMIILGLVLALLYTLYIVLLLRRDKWHRRMEAERSEEFHSGHNHDLDPLDPKDKAKDLNHDHSILPDESLLEADQIAGYDHRITFFEIYLKLKKRTFTNWKNLSCLERFFFVLEWPLQLFL